MSSEVIFKKLDQMKGLLNELEELLSKSLEVFMEDFVILRAAERDFQLLVELASDINTHILLEKEKPTPGSYRQSFVDLVNIGVLDYDLAEHLGKSARLRNILVHEYDFDEDIEKFYSSAKEMLPKYKEYISTMFKYIHSQK